VHAMMSIKLFAHRLAHAIKPHWERGCCVELNIPYELHIIFYTICHGLLPSAVHAQERPGGSPSRIKGPLVAKYQLVDLLKYSVSTP
jgi:hypothetical protein